MKTATTFLVAVLAALWLNAGAAAEKEYILTGAKPNKLFLIDAKARKVAKEYVVPGPGVGPGTIVPSPDNAVAYIVTNHTKSVTGIDLRTGSEVFRADMSRADDERTVNLGLAVSPDGKKIYSYEIPARILPDRYEVMPTRIAVYPANGGLNAAPMQTFAASRRIHMLMTSPDGKKLYALGWDLYTLDAETGKVLSTYPLRNWKRANASPPDLLNFWPMPEVSGVFSSIITYMRTDVPADDPRAFVMGMLTLDLKTGKADVAALKVDPAVYFTATLSPDRRYAYAGYLALTKIDMKKRATVKSVPLDHSYYQVNVSLDGGEVYVGGTMCDIAIYKAADLSRAGGVTLPGCPDMAAAALRVVKLDLGE